MKQTVFVNGIIHDEQQRVLLVRRSLKDHFLPGYLELPGGRVGESESLEHALKRKLQQELNMQIEGALFFRSIADTNSHGSYLRTYFEVPHSGKQEPKITNQHAEYIWADKQKLNDDKITTDTKKVLAEYLGSTDVVEKSAITDSANLTIYTDGGSRGNPGPSASGFVIYDDKNTIIEEGGAYIGITTNNQAEYTAVVLALEAAKKHAGLEAEIQFNIDSLLVVNQMNGVYKIKNRDLWPLNQQIRELMKSFKKVRFNHVYREQNTAADAKVNQLLDAHAEK